MTRQPAGPLPFEPAGVLAAVLDPPHPLLVERGCPAEKFLIPTWIIVSASGAFNMGPTAALLTDDGQTLVLTTLPVIDSSIERHRSLGLRPEQMRAIVAKGVHSPVPAYGPVAEEMIFVDSPGSTRADLSSLPYKNRGRALYPLSTRTRGSPSLVARRPFAEVLRGAPSR